MAGEPHRAEEAAKRERLRINEIFHSLQGEADAVGFRTVFVRLTGCPLRCRYCDTEYAFHAGDWHDIDAILEKVASFDTPHVCVTGGEPLAQPNCLTLLDAPVRCGLSRSRWRPAVRWISPRWMRGWPAWSTSRPRVRARRARNRVENFRLLTPRDQVKFVICSREDYDWSKAYRAGARAWPSAARCCSRPSYTQVSPTRARGLDFGGPAAGAISTAAPQGPVGRRAGKMKAPARRAAVGRPRLRHHAGDCARRRTFECFALSVHYGQRHSAELAAAKRVAAALGAREHRVMGVDLAGIGGSALTDSTRRRPRVAERGHSGHLRTGPQHLAAVARARLGGGRRRRRYLRGRERSRLLGLSRLPARNSSRHSRSSRSSRPRPASKAAASRSTRR